jgi:hypothetical protein
MPVFSKLVSQPGPFSVEKKKFCVNTSRTANKFNNNNKYVIKETRKQHITVTDIYKMNNI